MNSHNRLASQAPGASIKFLTHLTHLLVLESNSQGRKGAGVLYQNIPYIRIFFSSCSGDSETAAAQMSAEGYRHPRGGVRELGVQTK